MSRPLTFLVVTLLIAGAMTSGCASSGSGTAALGNIAIDPQLSPAENLARLAEAERRTETRHRVDAPVPPGVEPSALAPRSADDERAALTFAEAVEKLIALPLPVDSRPAAARISPDAAAEALRHYVKGREAMMNKRFYVAITELQAANKLDPTSPEILRELARAFGDFGNAPSAASTYEQLLRVQPNDPEALLNVGIAAATRRQFDAAAGLLARLRIAGAARSQDPAVGYLAHYYISQALQHLGYDRAAAEAARASVDIDDRVFQPTRYAQLFGRIYRRRGETWRFIGDAHCRLGEYEQALEAYATSSTLPMSDPASLGPRVVYANLRLGREFGAQRELLAALTTDESVVNDRVISLCSYLAEIIPAPDLLVQAVVMAYRDDPDEPSRARAAAALLPPTEASALLRDFVARRPEDLAVVGQLVQWLMQRDATAAVRLIVTLAEDAPSLTPSYVETLVQAAPRPSMLVDTIRESPASPTRAVLEARVLVSVEALGAAWDAARRAREQWPDDRTMQLLRIDLAASLEEPVLLEQAIADVEDWQTADAWVVRARARRKMKQHELAAQAADAALMLAPDHIDALVELARANASMSKAARTDSDRLVYARDAESSALRLEAVDPGNNDGFEVLATLYGTNGPLASQKDLESVLRRIISSNPDSLLATRLRIEDEIRKRRIDRALELLINLYENYPTGKGSLNLAVSLWLQQGRAGAAESWLTERLALRPGDPALLQEWVRVQLAQRQTGEAEQLLKETIAHEPHNEAARRLLEQVYRGSDRPELAMDLAERRLVLLPPGIHREIELVALYVDAGRVDEALPRLLWISDRLEQATVAQMFRLMEIVASLDGAVPEENEITLQLVNRVIDLYPDLSLRAYGIGLRALARRGDLDEEYDDFVSRTLAYAPGIAGDSPQNVGQLIRLAQALVDASHPEAAGRLLRFRLRTSPPPDAPVTAILTTATILADAAAGDRAPDSIALLYELAQSDRLGSLVPGAEEDRLIASALELVSIMYSLLGDDADTMVLLREWIAQEPDSAIAHNNLGYVMTEGGLDRAETARTVERAFELDPDDSNVLDTIGWLRYKQGRFTDMGPTRGAIELIRDALEQAELEDGPGADPSVEVLDHLGDTLWRLGDTEGAITAWKEARAVLERPEHAELHINTYLQWQVNWGLLAADPKDLYERNFGVILDRVERKLRQTEQGERPDVAPTFDEMSRTRATNRSPAESTR